MNLAETGMLISKIREYYPREKWDKSVNKQFIETWWDALSDFPANVIMDALKDYVRSNFSGFSPSIGQLIEIVRKKSYPSESYDEMKATDTIKRAASRSSMSRSSIYIGDTRTSAEREFDKLPDNLKMIVGSPYQLADWGSLSEDSFDSVIESHVIRAYRNQRESNGTIEKFSPESKEAIEKLQAADCDLLPISCVSEPAQESEDVDIEDAGLDDNTYQFIKDLIVRAGKIKEEKPRESIKTQTEVMREMSEDDLAKLAEVRRKWEAKRNAEDHKTN